MGVFSTYGQGVGAIVCKDIMGLWAMYSALHDTSLVGGAQEWITLCSVAVLLNHRTHNHCGAHQKRDCFRHFQGARDAV